MAALVSILILAASAAGSGVERPADASRLGLVAFQRIRIPDDVPAHLTTALAEDRDGFLWIGTQGGLVRYDGCEFKTFRHALGARRRLARSVVTRLWSASLRPGSRRGGLSDPAAVCALEMKDGTQWVGTNGNGIDVFDWNRGRIGAHRPALTYRGALADGTSFDITNDER